MNYKESFVLIKILLQVRSFFLWGSFWIGMFFTTTIAYFIHPFITEKSYDRVVDIVCHIILLFSGITLNVIGQEKRIDGKPVLYVANHTDIFDLFIMGHGLPDTPRGIELSSHFKWPGYGWFIKYYGNIPINYASKAMAMSAIKKGIKKLKNHSLLIMPEAHRTFTGYLEPFYAGAFLVAKLAKVPVVPVLALNAFDITKRGHFIFMPGKIDLKILDSIDTSEKSIEEIRDLAYDMMSREMEEYRKEHPVV